MKKKCFQKITACLIIIILGTPISLFAEEGQSDAETDDLVRKGKLTGGQDDIYLGDDHSSYKVEMEATSGFYYYNM